jgi:hypothetical protein
MDDRAGPPPDLATRPGMSLRDTTEFDLIWLLNLPVGMIVGRRMPAEAREDYEQDAAARRRALATGRRCRRAGRREQSRSMLR